jgi:hypothetical protein
VVSLDPGVVAAGGTAVLAASLDPPQEPGNKKITLKAVLESPERQELVFTILASAESDWIVSHDTIVLTGVVGRPSTKTIRIKGDVDVLTGITATAGDSVEVVEIRSGVGDERAFRVRAAIQTTSIDTLRGALVFRALKGTPVLKKVPIVERGAASSNWTTPIVELPISRSVELELNIQQEDRFVSVGTSSGLAVTELEPTSEERRRFRLTVDSDMSIDSNIGEVLARVSYGESVFDVPCRVVVTKPES